MQVLVVKMKEKAANNLVFKKNNINIFIKKKQKGDLEIVVALPKVKLHGYNTYIIIMAVQCHANTCYALNGTCTSVHVNITINILYPIRENWEWPIMTNSKTQT